MLASIICLSFLNFIDKIPLITLSNNFVGSGGIGLAAIRIALAYGLEVFTTVSTQQKRKFILSLFPQLKGRF